MVNQGIDPTGAQMSGNGFRFLSRGTVDDPRFMHMLATDKIHHLIKIAFALFVHPIANIRAIKTHDKPGGIDQKAGNDFLSSLLVSRCR